MSRNTHRVVILGWAGAAEKHVEKYSKIYEDRGYKTIQYTAPAYYIGWGIKKSREVAKLAETLLEASRCSQKLIFHMLSMNGILTFCSLILQYPELQIMEKCEALFFDSCPVHNISNHWKLIKAFSMIYDKKKVNTTFVTRTSLEVRKNLAIIKYVYSCARDSFLVKTGIIDLEEVSAFHYLLNHPKLPKVLSFVYSDMDSICDADLIHEFENTVKIREGRNVISTRFKDSQHVGHFRKYPELYLAQVDEFLRKIEGEFKAKL